MEWTDTYKQEAFRLPNGELNPVVYTFIFDVMNAYGERLALRFRNDNQWPYSPFLYVEYDPFGKNEHLGVRIPREERAQALGQLVIDRLYMRLGH